VSYTPTQSTDRWVTAAITVPLILGHLAVFLARGSQVTLAAYMLGYVASLLAAATSKKFRHLLIIPAAGFAIGLVAEIAGVNTGVPFGRYEYLSLRAPRLLGVPITVPIMWGFYSYLTYLVASSIIRRGGILKVLYTSTLMVLLDLAMDPFMVNVVHAWTWLSGWGPKWFGIPASNFTGWFIVSAAIIATHELTQGNAPTPNTKALTIPYVTLTIFFTTYIGPNLTGPIAAATTALIAIPATLTNKTPQTT